jgi:hypothetical protein
MFEAVLRSSNPWQRLRCCRRRVCCCRSFRSRLDQPNIPCGAAPRGPYRSSALARGSINQNVRTKLRYVTITLKVKSPNRNYPTGFESMQSATSTDPGFGLVCSCHDFCRDIDAQNAKLFPRSRAAGVDIRRLAGLFLQQWGAPLRGDLLARIAVARASQALTDTRPNSDA